MFPLGSHLLFQFDSETDGYKSFLSTRSTDCSTFFGTETASSFGSEAQCWWLSNSELGVVLGSNSEWDTQPFLTLKGETIRRLDTNSPFSTPGKYNIQPVNALPPQARVIVSPFTYIHTYIHTSILHPSSVYPSIHLSRK